MDVLVQTVRKEGILALYKGKFLYPYSFVHYDPYAAIGMASPLMGIAAVNSLLFTAYNVSKRIISPFPDLSLGQIALAGSMAGVGNSVLASPGE
jgi:solute carrier family 25 (mitochondrial carnitine/acylcarnitine transporter), member 20/29